MKVDIIRLLRTSDDVNEETTDFYPDDVVRVTFGESRNQVTGRIKRIDPTSITLDVSERYRTEERTLYLSDMVAVELAQE